MRAYILDDTGSIQNVIEADVPFLSSAFPGRWAEADRYQPAEIGQPLPDPLPPAEPEPDAGGLTARVEEIAGALNALLEGLAEEGA